MAPRDTQRSRASSRSTQATRVLDTDAETGSVLHPLGLAISWLPHSSGHKSAECRKVGLCRFVD